MSQFTQAGNNLQRLVDLVGGAILDDLGDLEQALRDPLTAIGLPQDIQTVVLLALTAGMILVALRRLGGMLRTVAILVLLVIGAHLLAPLLQQWQN